MEFAIKNRHGFLASHALSHEWLETNGKGSYASSTILNGHTRKYHGLLVSKLATKPDKYVLLSRFDDIFITQEKAYYLSAAEYPNFFQDGCWSNFVEFTLNPHPVFTYKFAGDMLRKELLLLQGKETILFKYTLTGKGSSLGKLRLRPLFAYRNFHALMAENSFLQSNIVKAGQGFSFSPYQDMPTMFFRAEGNCTIVEQADWYRDFLYSKEAERGFANREDLFSPAIIEFDLRPEQPIYFAFSLDGNAINLAVEWQQELARRQQQADNLTGTIFQRHLKQVANSFIENNAHHEPTSVVAGYHWFLNWGRDAMISLPGLTLFSQQETTCVNVLREFGRQEQDGLIPNIIGNTPEENAYNSVDASLWFGWAVQQYFFKTKNLEVVKVEFWDTLKNIFNYYLNGTKFNIKVQGNGLLYAGNPAINLSWMDAMVDGMPVTPRYGFQVEINALWYNLLAFMSELAALLLDPIRYEVKPLLAKVDKEFCRIFWNEEGGYLADYVNATETNLAIRPNQIFAISLPFSPVPRKNAARVMKVVREHLFTPVGLRTLSPKDPHYCSSYTGSIRARDLAYHNGTIWPWLMAHYAEAWIKVSDDRVYVKKMLQPCLEIFKAHLLEAGIGSISEVFSGESVFVPDGCISQAMSVAEILRLTYLLNVDI